MPGDKHPSKLIIGAIIVIIVHSRRKHQNYRMKTLKMECAAPHKPKHTTKVVCTIVQRRQRYTPKEKKKVYSEEKWAFRYSFRKKEKC
jgi:hypothetical protein